MHFACNIITADNFYLFSERYCNLSDRECQLSFLELQLELLDDFRLRLHQLSQCQAQETIDANYCGIMNAINYISSVLFEWNNLPVSILGFLFKINYSVLYFMLSYLIIIFFLFSFLYSCLLLKRKKILLKTY